MNGSKTIETSPKNGDAIVIRTNRGDEVLIDVETLAIIGDRSVYLQGRSAYPSIKIDNKHRLLHRIVLNAPNGAHVDHINRNKLDCRRVNLRLCSRAENGRNRGATKANSSGKKGVTLHRHTGKWQAQIKVNGKNIYLGLFADVSKAAEAYDAAALELHSDFALTNKELVSRKNLGAR